MDKVLYKRYEVNITLKSPLHISSGEGRSGYRAVITTPDRSLATDPPKPLIPASTIKGRMRDNFSKLVGEECGRQREPGSYCECPVCSIFGGTGYQPSRIYIEDFHLNEKCKTALAVRTGTAVDRYRRVVRDEALYKTQVVENAVFTGLIEVYFTTGTADYEKYLMVSLKMIETIGGGKSRGLGFVDVEVRELE